MSESQRNRRDKVSEYRRLIRQLGRKEFLFLKMIEYGFWPKNLPTPYEKQENESEEQYTKRKELRKKHNELMTQISEAYEERGKITNKIFDLHKELKQYDDLDRIRKELAKKIMQESIKKRAERKKNRELEKKRRSEAWKKKKEEEIVYVGKGYSSILHVHDTNKEKLNSLELPIIENPRELAQLFGIEYKQLRFLAYHRDVVSIDHYVRYTIPKRSGGTRMIAAPKKLLKISQRAILDKILSQIETSEYAHGFLKGKSVVSGVNSHQTQPYLIINMDMKDFFPTITIERIRGLFHSFGYSGHISTLLAIICTYCERISIDVRGATKYVATSRRILPQGSPASPMITNIICQRLDKRLNGLSNKYGFIYSRYADDLSFSMKEQNDVNLGRFCGLIYKVVEEEGFFINSSKTRFLRKNNQQKITGIILNNDEIGLPRKWIRNYRAAIYNANKELTENGNLSNEKIYEILGMTSWVKSVNPKRYSSLIESANKLLNM